MYRGSAERLGLVEIAVDLDALDQKPAAVRRFFRRYLPLIRGPRQPARRRLPRRHPPLVDESCPPVWRHGRSLLSEPVHRERDPEAVVDRAPVLTDAPVAVFAAERDVDGKALLHLGPPVAEVAGDQQEAYPVV